MHSPCQCVCLYGSVAAEHTERCTSSLSYLLPQPPPPFLCGAFRGSSSLIPANATARDVFTNTAATKLRIPAAAHTWGVFRVWPLCKRRCADWNSRTSRGNAALAFFGLKRSEEKMRRKKIRSTLTKSVFLCSCHTLPTGN